MNNFSLQDQIRFHMAQSYVEGEDWIVDVADEK